MFYEIRNYQARPGDDAQQLAQQTKAVYQSARWTDEIGPAVVKLIDTDQAVIGTFVPTPRSGLR